MFFKNSKVSGRLTLSSRSELVTPRSELKSFKPTSKFAAARHGFKYLIKKVEVCYKERFLLR